ncbi:MAG: hypothetical protein H6Q90_7076 [Deltaproteobacteria bacterium]|nr:hypothetical protein [Deltaproteobacteria bacterium]
MKRHDATAIEATLAAIDAALAAPVEITILGGAAVALHTHDAGVATKDIDTWQLGSIAATRLAAAAAKSQIEIGPASIADLPYEFESRRQRILPSLIRLSVYLPEIHDLALSKMLRWSDGDERHLQVLHANSPLDASVLVERYMAEMQHAIGDHRRHRQHLILCIESLFGDLAKARAETALRG